jgi:hypothetical protein
MTEINGINKVKSSEVALKMSYERGTICGTFSPMELDTLEAPW